MRARAWVGADSAPRNRAEMLTGIVHGESGIELAVAAAAAWRRPHHTQLQLPAFGFGRGSN